MTENQSTTPTASARRPTRNAPWFDVDHENEVREDGNYRDDRNCRHLEASIEIGILLSKSDDGEVHYNEARQQHEVREVSDGLNAHMNGKESGVDSRGTED